MNARVKASSPFADVALGFGVTSNIAQKLLLEEAAGWSGLQGVYVSGEHAAMLNIKQGFSLLIETVAEGGPASQLGVWGGTIQGNIGGRDLILGENVLLSINGIKITDMGPALAVIRTSMIGIAPGSTLTVTVLREGKELELSTVVRLRRTDGGLCLRSLAAAI